MSPIPEEGEWPEALADALAQDANNIAYSRAVRDACLQFEALLALIAKIFGQREVDLSHRFDVGHFRHGLNVRSLDLRETEPGYSEKPRIGQNEFLRQCLEAMVDPNASQQHPGDIGCSFDDWVDMNDLLARAITAVGGEPPTFLKRR